MSSLTCTACGQTYGLNDPRWRCGCGGLLSIHFQPQLDPVKIRKRKPNLWRYREAIPLEDDVHIVSFEEGYTPLLRMPIAGFPVWVKQDHLFPSGSYKDRGASVLISKARELNITSVVEDSSGNAGCAIAAYCARAGIACRIFVPASTSPGKLAQIRMMGAELNLIPGSREDTARAVLQAADNEYYASHSWNPFFFQGTKTWAYEVCEQLGQNLNASGWAAPDTVVLPAGNGTLLLGAAIGFEDLLQAGLVEKMPRIIAVQSANCAPLERAFAENAAQVPAIEQRETLAEGIAIAEPVRGMEIVLTVRRSGGRFLTVTEDQIRAALRATAAAGHYIEPTSAAVIAGVEQYVQTLSADECVVSVFTGHGLKSTEKILKL